ncbi:hypothetical protein NM208_g11434 [Fusarium decemcellulare]|uniref:Uncharacterized protein n=1 Tax=Fusarium decemcellulare TaxID=57161 RepID=A0ACC1RUQ3_9HYPO|nr:hypothetical protein NM208_g11434 [Fusarium decemcellulare]
MSQIANVGKLSLDPDADSQLSSQEPFQTAPAPDSAQPADLSLPQATVPTFPFSGRRNGTLPRSPTPFLIDHGVFVAAPEAPASPVSRSRRAQSAPPSGIRKRKLPAELDGDSYAPLPKRRDWAVRERSGQRNSGGGEERQKLSSVKSLL